MERVTFIQHKGKAILYIDLAGCSTAEVLPIIEEAKAAVKTRHRGSLLTLTDVTGTGFDSVVSVAMKDLVQHNKPYVSAAAVVGVTGVKQIIFNSVMRFSGRHLHAFESLEAAKDWLAAR
jgi:hypothetical protein